MTKYSLTVLAVLGAVVATAQPARAEHTRVTNPNVLYVEGLGRAVAYSVGYDRMVDDNLAAGIGFSTISVTMLGTSTSTTLIPFYANYYFVKEQGSPFLTGGFDLVSGKTAGTAVGDIPFDKNVIGTVGLGYESRSDAGFTLRITGYGLIADKFYPWGGITLGYAF